MTYSDLHGLALEIEQGLHDISERLEPGNSFLPIVNAIIREVTASPNEANARCIGLPGLPAARPGTLR